MSATPPAPFRALPGLAHSLSERLHTFDSLQIRDYRLLWLGQLGTSMGQWMDQISRGWLIYQITGSPLQLGLVTAARGLPLLFFGVLAGAVADRSGHKTQLIVAQSTNAALNAILATLVLTHNIAPWHVYVTAFLAGTMQAFQQPARQSLISDLAGRRHLLNALALNSMALNASRVLGPSIGGGLIAFVGVQGSYYLQAALYAYATLWTVQMHVPERSAESERVRREPLVTSIQDGLAYVAGQPQIRTLMVIALGPLTLAQQYSSLMPVFAIDVLHGDARLQGLLLTCVGAGALAGAVTVASLRRRNGYGLGVSLGAILFSLFVIGFGASPWLALSLPLLILTGFFSTTYTTQNQSLLQILAPSHLRSRVMSIYLLNRALTPLAGPLAGALASLLGGQAAVLLLGGTSLALVAAVTLRTPEFRSLRVSFEEEMAEPLIAG